MEEKTGMAGNGWKWLEMAGHGWKWLTMVDWRKWLEMAGYGQNDWKWLKMAENFLKRLYYAIKAGNRQIKLEVAGNGSKLLETTEMAGICWKRLDIT